ncbi:MAG: DUF4421 domain-containing protein [Muribaculaceae bacterium]|nr:DUF4421 domain-containing protein [Muribaculaceae bacterium]
MKRLVAIIMALTALSIWAVTDDHGGINGVANVVSRYVNDSTLLVPIDNSKMSPAADSIYNTSRDTMVVVRNWKHAIRNRDWNYFIDPTIDKPLFLDLVSKVYNFYTKAFNNYDTTYVVGIDQNWKAMIISENWLNSYGGMIANNNMKVFMSSAINSSVGAHLSYLGIGYTYMFDLDNVFGGDPTRHSKWDLSFATSRFSFEAYKSRNSGTVTISRFGDYNNKRLIRQKFSGIKQQTWGFDMYYFFNHRKYSQAAAYSFSKIQKRSAGTMIGGFLISSQNVDVDFSELPQDMIDIMPGGGEKLQYKFHHRSYCFLVGYAYNWVFHRNWLYNITVAPSVGWNHSFDDSVDGKRDFFALDLRGRMSLVHNAGKYFFWNLQLLLDAHLYHSKDHNFINSQEDITITAGVRF